MCAASPRIRWQVHVANGSWVGWVSGWLPRQVGIGPATDPVPDLDLPHYILCAQERVLNDAKTDKGSIDEVVLVGGSTRIPKVQTMLQVRSHNYICKGRAGDQWVGGWDGSAHIPEAQTRQLQVRQLQVMQLTGREAGGGDGVRVGVSE